MSHCMFLVKITTPTVVCQTVLVGVEGWKVGRGGRLEDWKIGRLEEGEIGRLEEVEGWILPLIWCVYLGNMI